MKALYAVQTVPPRADGIYQKGAELKAELADQLRMAQRRAGTESTPEQFGQTVEHIWDAIKGTVLGQGWTRELIRRWTRVLVDRLVNGITDAQHDDWRSKSLEIARSRYGSLRAGQAAIDRANQYMRDDPALADLRDFLRVETVSGIASHPQIVSDILDDLSDWERQAEQKARLRGFHGYTNDDEPPRAA